MKNGLSPICNVTSLTRPEDRAGCVVRLDPAHQPLAIVTTERLYARIRAALLIGESG